MLQGVEYTCSQTNVCVLQEETRKARHEIMQLQQRLDRMDIEQDEEDEEVEAMQLTRAEIEQMLGESPMHTELKNQLDKVCTAC
jgi:hypothetical protein